MPTALLTVKLLNSLKPMLVKKFHQQRDAIAADRHLTNEGKAAAIEKARTTAHAAIAEWNAQRHETSTPIYWSSAQPSGHHRAAQ